MHSIKDRIGQLKTEIEELQFQLALKKNALQELQSLTGKRSQKASRQKLKPPRATSLAAYLQKVLTESNGPLAVSELVEKLKESGYHSKADIKTVVPCALSRRPDIFFRVKYGVYDLKSRHKDLEGH